MSVPQQNGEITSFTPGWYWHGLGHVPVYAIGDAEPGWARYCTLYANKQAPLDPVTITSRCPASQLIPAMPPAGRPRIEPTDSAVREAYLRWRRAKENTTSVLLVHVSSLPDLEYVTFYEDAETISLVAGVSPNVYTWWEFGPKRHPLFICGVRTGYRYVLTSALLAASISYDDVPETAVEEG